jgi:transcriptional repressor NrdR
MPPVARERPTGRTGSARGNSPRLSARALSRYILCASLTTGLDIGVDDVMRCPFCGHAETKVVDSRVSESQDAIRRRRECLQCAQRFTTYERREEMPLMVIKKDGRHEPFDRMKLLQGLHIATAKRDVSPQQLEHLIDDIDSELHNEFLYEIPTKALGDMVLKRLKDLDRVAYVRFASVYKEFSDLDEFTSELKNLK